MNAGLFLEAYFFFGNWDGGKHGRQGKKKPDGLFILR